MTEQEMKDQIHEAEQDAYAKGMRDACFELANWLVCKGPKEVAEKSRPLEVQQVRNMQMLAVGLYHGGPHEDQDVQTAAEFEREFTDAAKEDNGIAFIAKYTSEYSYYAPLVLTILLSQAKLQQDPHA